MDKCIKSAVENQCDNLQIYTDESIDSYDAYVLFVIRDICGGIVNRRLLLQYTKGKMCERKMDDCVKKLKQKGYLEADGQLPNAAPAPHATSTAPHATKTAPHATLPRTRTREKDFKDFKDLEPQNNKKHDDTIIHSVWERWKTKIAESRFAQVVKRCLAYRELNRINNRRRFEKYLEKSVATEIENQPVIEQNAAPMETGRQRGRQQHQKPRITIIGKDTGSAPSAETIEEMWRVVDKLDKDNDRVWL